MSPFPRCPTCGKPLGRCDCPDADEDDTDYAEPAE